MIAGLAVVYVIVAAAAIPLGNRLRMRADNATPKSQQPTRGHALEDVS